MARGGARPGAGRPGRDSSKTAKKGHTSPPVSRVRTRARGRMEETHSPGMRRELVDLARRYDRRGDHFDGRPR